MQSSVLSADHSATSNTHYSSTPDLAGNDWSSLTDAQGRRIEADAPHPVLHFQVCPPASGFGQHVKQVTGPILMHFLDPP